MSLSQSFTVEITDVTRRVGRFSHRQMTLIYAKVDLARARSAGACTPQPNFLALPR
jgi:hypothetical protein